LLATVDDAVCEVVIFVVDETVSLSCIVIAVAVAAVPAVVASVMETQTKRVHTVPVQQGWSVLVADRNSCLQSID
jgi:hypothetical protein